MKDTNSKSPSKAPLRPLEDSKPEFTENPRFLNDHHGPVRGIGPASPAGRVALATAQAAAAPAARPPPARYPPNPADMGSGSGGSDSQKDSYKLQVRTARKFCRISDLWPGGAPYAEVLCSNFVYKNKGNEIK